MSEDLYPKTTQRIASSQVRIGDRLWWPKGRHTFWPEVISCQRIFGGEYWIISILPLEYLQGKGEVELPNTQRYTIDIDAGCLSIDTIYPEKETIIIAERRPS